MDPTSRQSANVPTISEYQKSDQGVILDVVILSSRLVRMKNVVLEPTSTGSGAVVPSMRISKYK